jgi:hypothetical protein
MNPQSNIHLIFDKGAKTYNGEKIASSTNVAGKTEARSMSSTLYKYQFKVD